MFQDEKVPIIPNLDRFEIVGIQQQQYRYNSKYSDPVHEVKDYFRITILKDTKTGVLYTMMDGPLGTKTSLTVLVDKDGKPCTELD